ncbi:TKL protein kinase [Phytophthora nicotianae CJ01A1]|uniref:TKL protein kinase n=3 Tax=Phytophthora nicotianae TaxID=4792 RepID=W2QKP6_PHYN3|nr:TKL protein kinase [Phytophthora nicotianae INRA-310]ETK93261.1 TKL protein kinase [Phytophthora nicotianae]ETP23208.1 TKL protein kinase [Phytophthora nicotianae CJ01A1]ETL46705.1 TKL protein kinase [Phytophthora nicotianae]ETL99813.1 TKL protein kinase [Phytophthora nicotianae]ETM52971.1 TKL protein kinase [Phytophthora nicotianae]
MGLVAFLTCGACSSRRKRGHENFPDTITIPTPSAQSHNAALAHHHPYDIHGTPAPAPAAREHRNTRGEDRSRDSSEPRRDRRTSNPQPRVSSGPNRVSSGPNRSSSAQPRQRSGSRPQQYQPQHPEQRSRPQQHDRHARHDRPAVRNIEPVAPEKLRPSGGSGGSGNNRDSEITDRSKEVASKVLEQFQSDPTLGRMRIPYSSLYFTRVLSKGAFGEVWLAQLENRQVAVKRILNEKKNDEKEIECFGAEIKLMASFSHPKIVEFVGVSWSSMQDVCAVTEYMAKGDLYGFLKRRQGQLNWRDHKIFLAEDVADALGYLHGLSPKVIHRDLKSKNILLDDAFRAKLSDFGISRERSVEDTMTAGVGTIYWTAPEVLMGKKYTEKADIFSFGIVMSELDTHAVPYSDKRDASGKKLQGMKIVQMVIRRNLRPTFSSDCPPLVKELADRCLDSDPDVRPSAMELLRIIQRMQNLL